MNPINQTTTLLRPTLSDPASQNSKKRKVMEEKVFTFDNSFWSFNRSDDHYAHQSDVYNALGEEFLDHNFEGYHTCIFAYGQTGSGKSYTMMGTPDEPGLIPRTCEDLFERIEAAREETPNISYHVRVSYFEVYNEHVRDLLVPVQANQPAYYLKIRESPTEGPYINNLIDAPVRNIKEIMKYMKMGDGNRTVASTKMNDSSSRSHAVFTIMLKQIHHDIDQDETTERMARIRLVDLAGSERAKSTEATGARLREGGNINKSLTTLGRVIAALADLKQQTGNSNSSTMTRPHKRSRDVVPYRDSILTWLLKDSLGGNSKTAMIACISPSDYDETLSTLRYADQAKRIRTRAIVNQDQISAAERDAQIAAMAEEIRLLQLRVSDSRRREKEDTEKEDEVEKWQAKVSEMQRAMEEKDSVQSGKIRSLQTENEALRLHLRLLLDHHNNPIEINNRNHNNKKNAYYNPSDNSNNSINESQPNCLPKSHLSPMATTKTNVIDINLKPLGHSKKIPRLQDIEVDEENDVNDISIHDGEVYETQLEMQDLLSSLSMFKKKLFEDKKRFAYPPPPYTKMPTDQL